MLKERLATGTRTFVIKTHWPAPGPTKRRLRRTDRDPSNTRQAASFATCTDLKTKSPGAQARPGLERRTSRRSFEHTASRLFVAGEVTFLATFIFEHSLYRHQQASKKTVGRRQASSRQKDMSAFVRANHAVARARLTDLSYHVWHTLRLVVLSPAATVLWSVFLGKEKPSAYCYAPGSQKTTDSRVP